MEQHPKRQYSTRVTHASRRNSPSVEIQEQEVLSLWDALRCSTHLSIRWRHCKILRPTCNFLQMHLQEPECFLVHKWCVSEETHLVILRLLHEIPTRRSTSKSGTKKDYLSCYLRSPGKSTFKCLCKQTPLWLVIMSCHWLSGPKPEIQHDQRGRDVPTLTWEEVTIREGKRRCCNCIKMEIMSLRLKVKVIFSLQARSL